MSCVTAVLQYIRSRQQGTVVNSEAWLIHIMARFSRQ